MLPLLSFSHSLDVQASFIVVMHIVQEVACFSLFPFRIPLIYLVVAFSPFSFVQYTAFYQSKKKKKKSSRSSQRGESPHNLSF